MIRIAVAQGPSAAWKTEPDKLVNASPIDFLILDYLSDHSFVDLEMKRNHDPEEGYISEILPLIDRVTQDLTRRRIRLLTNAGGANPHALATRVIQTLHRENISASQIVSITKEIPQLILQGHRFVNLYTGNEFSAEPHSILATNIEMNCEPAAKSLNEGVGMAIIGPCSTSSMVLASMVHRYSLDIEDWNTLAAGIVAGHLVRPDSCCIQYESEPPWRSPLILEIDSDGCFTLTKDSGTGGTINTHTVRQQLLHQMGDPSQFFSPDVMVDLTSVTVREDGENRVRVSGINGKPTSCKLRMVIYYRSENSEVLTEWPTLIDQMMVRRETMIRKDR